MSERRTARMMARISARARLALALPVVVTAFAFAGTAQAGAPPATGPNNDEARPAAVKTPPGADKESLPLINAQKAHEAGFTGTGTAVAVLDSGGDWKRAAFGPCTEPNAPQGNCRVVFAKDFAPDDGVLDDRILHGTNVSGIVAGVAPGTKLIILDVFAGERTNASYVLSALDWVVKNKKTFNIVAVNMSIGNEQHETKNCTFLNPYRSAFSQLRAAGVLPVVSAGNSASSANRFTNGLASPACTAGAVSVGAVYDSNIGPKTYRNQCSEKATRADQPTCWGQSGPNLSLYAPGASIDAANVKMMGTSQAAPHVAGAVAALASQCSEATADQLEQALITNGAKITDSRNNVSKVRLDMLAAGKALQKQGLCG